MNVLLIYPEIPDTFWSFRHALRFIGKKAASPPLGLLTIAAMLPAEWPKRLVDMNVEKLTEEHLRWAEVAFVSAMTIQRDAARRVIARCKRAGLRVVAGGPLFTVEPETFEEVDHLVLNEAESTLPRFLEDFGRGQPKHIYHSSEYPDLAGTPIPLWELLDLNRYATMNVQFSRGCPYDCDFCNVTALFGQRPRAKSAAQVILELDSLYALGWRGGVFFVDDNLIGHKRRLKAELLPALIEWKKDKRGIPFTTEVSINLADDPELIQLMVEAGFSAVFIGIETPAEESLAECSKKQNLNREPGGGCKAHSEGRIAGAGGLYRGLRPRHAFYLPASDRFHPEQQHRHGYGRVIAGAPWDPAL